jgi:hypothetical protein
MQDDQFTGRCMDGNAIVVCRSFKHHTGDDSRAELWSCTELHGVLAGATTKTHKQAYAWMSNHRSRTTATIERMN